MKILEHGDNWIIEDQLDNELVDQIRNFVDKNCEGWHESIEGYSSTGNVKQYWIAYDRTYDKKEYNDIEEKLRQNILGRLKKSSFLRDNVSIEFRSAGTVIGQEGAYHKLHNHGDGAWDGLSTVLYLNMPETDDCDYVNDIHLVLHTDPKSKYISSYCPSIHSITPKVGTLLMFPPNIPHTTFPQSKGIRQTFNVNYDYFIVDPLQVPIDPHDSHLRIRYI